MTIFEFNNFDSLENAVPVEVVSTSARTADVAPITLRETDTLRLRFLPVLVNNSKNEGMTVEGKIVYERKSRKSDAFPSENANADDRVTRGTIRQGDWLELSLSTSETFALFDGLRSMYSLYEDIGGIPSGRAEFVPVDRQYADLMRMLKSDPSSARMLASRDNYELVRLLMRLITQSDSIDALKESLEDLEAGNLRRLSTSLNLEQLERAVELFRSNLDNSDEEFWQKTVFADSQWLLSQIFASPCTIFDSKAYVGGKAISNTGGNVCDFIYQNKLTSNIALIEIKTPGTPILGRQYRSTYSLSDEMSGAINQVLNYRDKLVKEYYQLAYSTSDRFEAFSPKCVVVIGNSSELDSREALAAFENYRAALTGVSIITYDELLQRMVDLVEILNDESSGSFTDHDQHCPF